MLSLSRASDERVYQPLPWAALAPGSGSVARRRSFCSEARHSLVFLSPCLWKSAEWHAPTSPSLPFFLSSSFCWAYSSRLEALSGESKPPTTHSHSPQRDTEMLNPGKEAGRPPIHCRGAHRTPQPPDTTFLETNGLLFVLAEVGACMLIAALFVISSTGNIVHQQED